MKASEVKDALWTRPADCYRSGRDKTKNKEQRKCSLTQEKKIEQARMEAYRGSDTAVHRFGSHGSSTAKNQYYRFYLYASFRHCTPAPRRTCFTY